MTEPTPTTYTELVKKYGGWITAVVLVLGYLGVLNPEQVQKWVSGTTTAVAYATVGDEPVVPPPPEPPAPVSVDVTLTDEQVDKIVEQVVNRIVPLVTPPAPTPEPQPAPTPEDLRPEIVVTEESGETFNDAEVPAGKLLMVTASKKVPVGWAISRYGDTRVLLLPDNLGYAISLQAGASVEFFLTDASLKAVSLRISCNQAPQPPPPVVPDVKPEPPQPVPTPTPKPTPPNIEKTRVFLAVVEADVRQLSPETAKMLASLDTWNEFREKGNDYRFYDSATSEPKGKQAVLDAGTLDKPVLVIYDKLSGTKLAAFTLPMNRRALKETVSQYTGDLYTEEADVRH